MTAGARADGRPRVLVLGHSVAYAVGVDAEYSWTQVLENELRAQGLERAEVLNLAVPGYTLEQMLAVWGEVGRALAPDLVLLNEEENRREDAQALQSAGVTCHVSFPRDSLGTAAMVRDIGAALGAAVMGGEKGEEAGDIGAVGLDSRRRRGVLG